MNKTPDDEPMCGCMGCKIASVTFLSFFPIITLSTLYACLFRTKYPNTEYYALSIVFLISIVPSYMSIKHIISKCFGYARNKYHNYIKNKCEVFKTD